MARPTNKFATSHTIEGKGGHLLPDMSYVLVVMRRIDSRVGGVDSWRWMNMNSLELLKLVVIWVAPVLHPRIWFG